MTAATLEIRNARVALRLRAGDLTVIPDLSLTVFSKEAYGLVGESGCGKSTVALAVMNYLGRVGKLLSGNVLLQGEDMALLTPGELRARRGRRVAMVYQDPMSSLNPTMTVGRQLAEVVETHGGLRGEAARASACAMLAEVRLPDPETMLERYPHQLSGGQQQRVVIAMAMIAEPALLVMDEPTTALDVTVEAAVLDLVEDLRRRRGTSILFISHNLGTVARVCDRVGVMYGGEIVEEGPVRDVFGDPRHPYTRGLLACLPTLDVNKHSAPLEPIHGQVGPLWDRPFGCFFAPRCPDAISACRRSAIPMDSLSANHSVRCIRATDMPEWKRRAVGGPHVPLAGETEFTPLLEAEHLRKRYMRRSIFGALRGEVLALKDVSLDAPRGITLAIVGESGSGKSTFAKVLTGLATADDGLLRFGDAELAHLPTDARDRMLKRRMQMVFQNPDGTLNPSHTVGYAIGRAVKRLRKQPGENITEAVARLLEIVRLPHAFAERMPRQLSGGEKQRVAIARALAGDPELIIADEPVSGLDVSVQAAIVNLLNDLQAATLMTMVFISHDLGVVRYLADRVAVMYRGAVIEFGAADKVFAPPYHPYTEALLSAIPKPDSYQRREQVLLDVRSSSISDCDKGCVFADRCPRKLGSICDEARPPEAAVEGHRIACHIPRETLVAMQIDFRKA